MVNLKLEEQIGEVASPEPRSQGHPVLAAITWRHSPAKDTAQLREGAACLGFSQQSLALTEPT